MLYPIDRCCERKKCVAPDQELRVEHKYPTCNKIVHTLCAKFDFDTNAYYWKRCDPPPPAPKVSVTGNSVPSTEKTPKIVRTTSTIQSP